MKNFYEWLVEVAAQKPVPPQPKQKYQQTPTSQTSKLLAPCYTNLKSPECQTAFQQVNKIYTSSKNPQEKKEIKDVVTAINQNVAKNKQQQAPWSNVDISQVKPEVTDPYGFKLFKFLEPCTYNLKGKECQQAFSQVNQYYKTTQNQQEKNTIKKYINVLNKLNKEDKQFSRSLDVASFKEKIDALAKPCYDKKPEECQKNLKILQNGFNDPKQGKQGKEIIKKHLDTIQSHQQKIQNIQNNEKQAQAALQGGQAGNAMVPTSAKSPAAATNWIEVQSALAGAASYKNLKAVQKIIQQYPNMPATLKAHANNLVRILDKPENQRR